MNSYSALRLRYLATNRLTLELQFDDRNYHGWQVYRNLLNAQVRVSSGSKGARSTLIGRSIYTTPDFSPLLIASYAELKLLRQRQLFATDKAKAYRFLLDKGINAHMDMLKSKLAPGQRQLTSWHQVWAWEHRLALDWLFSKKNMWAMFLHQRLGWRQENRLCLKRFTPPANFWIQTLAVNLSGKIGLSQIVRSAEMDRTFQLLTLLESKSGGIQ